MKKVRHTSGRARTIADPEFPRIVTDENGEAEVPEALAKSLLAQPDRWEAVSDTKTKKAATSGEEA